MRSCCKTIFGLCCFGKQGVYFGMVMRWWVVGSWRQTCEKLQQKRMTLTGGSWYITVSILKFKEIK